MSKYTTQLRYPIEQMLDDLGLSRGEANWHECYRMLGLDDYPIFDELHRGVLNGKIIRRYYFREIGFETMALFRWSMRSTMHDIMPYYNQLYESQLFDIDPFLTRNLRYTDKWSRGERTGRTSSGNNTSKTDGRNVFNDTPMNGLDTGSIQNMEYASSVTFDNDSTSTDSRSSTDFKGDFSGAKEHDERGSDKSQSELLLTYRETFLNIDKEVVDNLSHLFMGLW